MRSRPGTFRTIATVLTRIVVMTTIASLLILVLLPVALAAQAHGA